MGCMRAGHSGRGSGSSNYTPRKGRNDFTSAVRIILDRLEGGEPYTVNKLTDVTGLNYRTVKKALALLESVQAELESKRLDISHADKMTMVHMKARVGMTSLPDNIQQLIIKTAYYPTPSAEEELLVHLLLHKAVGPASARPLRHFKTVDELVEAGQIGSKDGKYYLSSMGKTVAEGSLKIYPELRDMV